MLLSLALLALIQPEAATTAPAGQWISPPSLTAHDYPPRALDEGLSGSATVRCEIQEGGVPGNCVALTEDPVGYGFGEATIRIVQRARLSIPELQPGEPYQTLIVRMPFVLDLSPPPPVDTSGPPSGWIDVECRVGAAFVVENCAAVSSSDGFVETHGAAAALLEGRVIPERDRRRYAIGETFLLRIPYWSGAPTE